MKVQTASSFSIVLSVIALMMLGFVLIPMLSVQYSPPVRSANIVINTHWSGASAKIMEAELTSKIEGVLASIAGVEDIKSISSYEHCAIFVRFKKGLDQKAIRFEISSRLRSIYPQFPKGVSYPSISMDVKNKSENQLLTYSFSANLPLNQIKKEVEKRISKPLSEISGVKKVSVYGDLPREWVIYFDALKCQKYQITPADIQLAFRIHQGSFPLGMVQTESHSSLKSVSFFSQELSPEEWRNIEVKNIDGYTFSLGDIATIIYQEEVPTSYFRMNGLNNISLLIYPKSDENQIKLSREIQRVMRAVETDFPQNFSVLLIEDGAQYIISELSKVAYRTGLSILILLIFVFLVSRSFRYLTFISLSLLASILLSIICYYFFDLEIHLYSLAGMTVSLGMTMDTAIIMSDHYARFKNKKVFLAMLAATLTTMGALSIVYFLPESHRQNLLDFSIIIIINLSVSLIIAYFFIPALQNQFPLQLKQTKNNFKKKRRIVKIGQYYLRFLTFAKAKKWIFIVLIILAFGVPVHLLPQQLDTSTEKKSILKHCKEVYNVSLGSRFFQYEIKKYLEYTLGGSFRVFAKNVFSKFQVSDIRQTILYVHGAMPDGCSVQQLNEAFVSMESFLSSYNEINVFSTQIQAYNEGLLKITFKKPFDNTIFAEDLKSAILQKTLAVGGVNWNVFGVGSAFINNQYSGDYRRNSITLCGYSYDQLYRLAEKLKQNILKNPRVVDPIIAGASHELKNKTEFFMQMNPMRLASAEIPLATYYSLLQPLFYDASLGSSHNGEYNENIVLRTSPNTRFDAWHLNQELIFEKNRALKLSEFGELAKTEIGNNIYKENQEYLLTVGFNYIGSDEDATKFTVEEIERLKRNLAVGYRVHQTHYNLFTEDKSLPLILLIIVVLLIYFICAVLFESLLQPLVIIILIPISFIGVFLSFWGFSIPFDEGGFASFVLLSGVVVNAGIYLVNEYNYIVAQGIKPGLPTYLRCFHRKIVPISITILSTALGLLPFVLISKDAFWYSFAIGGIGGLLFSFVAILLFLPIFFPTGNRYARS